MPRIAAVPFVLVVLVALAGPAAAADDVYALHPIGRVEVQGDSTRILLEPQYRPGLLRLEDFSHLWVIWWFDRNDTPERRGILQVHPRRDARNPLSGVFATRAPVRPNLLGLSLCRILAVREDGVEVDGIDAFPGTPVLDLKPYIPGMESVPDARVPARY
jgi:tRNA-Thr(GGU) m(6)t(6)A37 methyltransferase TsaA